MHPDHWWTALQEATSGGLLEGVSAITVAGQQHGMARNEPDHLARTRTCVLPHDWLTSRLLAGDGPVQRRVTDRSDASGTGYFSASTNAYHDDLLRLATGRGDLQLPEVLGPGAAAGRNPRDLVVGPRGRRQRSGRAEARPDQRRRGRLPRHERHSGAARQAAWALSGEDTCPRWTAVEHVVGAEPVAAPSVEEIMGRYAELLATVHGVRQ